MPIESTDIKIKLSRTAGSAGNSGSQSDPNASLGKYISTTELSGTALNNLFDNVSGDENALGTVEYRCLFIHNAHASLTWQSPKIWLSGFRATAIASTNYIVATGHVFANGHRVRVKADYLGDSLPGSLSDSTTYYVINSATDTFQVSLTSGGAAVDITTDGGNFSVRQYGNCEIAIGIDDTAASDIGASSAQAATIANETSVPSGVLFTTPLTKADGLSLGNLAAGKCRALWIRRTPLNLSARNTDGFTIASSGDTAE